MTPWVWPTMALNPPSWIEPITEACRSRRCVVLHHRHRPGVRQRPVPDDPDGTVQRGAPGAGARDPRLHQLRGRLRGRDGDRPAARVRPAARAHRHPGHVLGRHRSDDGPRRGGRARRDHHHLGEVGHRQAHHHGQGRDQSGRGGGHPVHHQRDLQGEPRICLEHVNRVGNDAAPDWPRGNKNDVYRVEIEGTPSITQETAFRFTDGSGRDAAAAGCLATGLRALNAVPGGEPPPARLGDRPRSAAHPRRGYDPMAVSRPAPRELTGPGITTADRGASETGEQR